MATSGKWLERQNTRRTEKKSQAHQNLGSLKISRKAKTLQFRRFKGILFIFVAFSVNIVYVLLQNFLT